MINLYLTSRTAVRRLFAFLFVPTTEPELAAAQYRAFQHQVPLVYVILLSNAWILAASYAGTAPLHLTFSLPFVLSAVCVPRLIMWWRGRGQNVEPEKARTELLRANLLSWILSLGFSSWAISLGEYGSWSGKMHVAFFMATTTIGCLACLSQMRSAAIAVLAICSGSFVVFFAATQNPTLVAMAINMLLVGAAMIILVQFNYRDFNALVVSRRVLQEERSRAIALSDQNLRLANLDSLTNLPNRRSFFSTLPAMVERRGAQGDKVILGILDLDGFKSINDTFGHGVGDTLLRRVVDRLVTLAGQDFQLFRLGGDEFALIFESSDIEEVQTLASGVAAALRDPFQLPACTALLSGTTGLAIYPDMASNDTELFERADYAMYHAKRDVAPGGVRLFTTEDEAEIRRSSAIEQALKTADLESELSMVFQPIVDLHTNCAVGFEALARWQSRELGAVSPGEFVPVAERAGLINRVTLVLLRRALAAAEAWPQSIRLSFNLSVCDIVSPEGLMRIIATIGQSKVSPSRIDFEITETAMVGDFHTLMQAVETLKRIGVGISIDDFGTGYSSLRQVHQLPLDKLKVDRSFVSNINANPAGQKILKSLLSLCDELQLSCVVEGVETAGELEAVRALGCELVQGFYYSRPLDADAALDYLARQPGALASGPSLTQQA